MIETIDDLIRGVEADNGYLTDAWLDDLRAFDFKVHDAARFLAWLPNIKPHLACCSISLAHGKTALGSPAELIEFHTGGWSGAEELMAAMLGHFWITSFHTKWRRGGHFAFEIPTKHLSAPSNEEGSLDPTILPQQQTPRLNEIVGFMLFSASRSGSWQAWRRFKPDERQRFLDWAEQEIAQLAKIGWFLTAEHSENAQASTDHDRADKKMELPGAARE